MVCEAFFYLKNLKFTCLEIFLSFKYLDSSVKTTNVSEIALVHSSDVKKFRRNLLDSVTRKFMPGSFKIDRFF